MMKRYFSMNHIEFRRLAVSLGAVLTGVVVFLLTLTVGAYLEAAPVYDDTLRLHIRAANPFLAGRSRGTEAGVLEKDTAERQGEIPPRRNVQ